MSTGSKTRTNYQTSLPTQTSFGFGIFEILNSSRTKTSTKYSGSGSGSVLLTHLVALNLHSPIFFFTLWPGFFKHPVKVGGCYSWGNNLTHDARCWANHDWSWEMVTPNCTSELSNSVHPLDIYPWLFLNHFQRWHLDNEWLLDFFKRSSFNNTLKYYFCD